jgi:hypothetical protein
MRRSWLAVLVAWSILPAVACERRQEPMEEAPPVEEAPPPAPAPAPAPAPTMPTETVPGAPTDTMPRM